MKSIVAGALLAFLGFASSAQAALTIVVPNVNLAPNTPNQPVTVAVNGGDMVTGVVVDAVLGNGSAAGVEPIFQSFDFTTGTMFSDTAAHPGTKIGGTVGGVPQDAQVSYALNTQNDTVAASGNFITLFISTVNLTSGTYALSLGNTEIGQDTHFLLPGGASDQPLITNGTITITAIPEPSSMLALLAGGLLLVRRRRAA